MTDEQKPDEQKPDEQKPDDRNRAELLKCAGACLDHVRIVRWGEAKASYVFVENDLTISVMVHVSCYRKADKAPVT